MGGVDYSPVLHRCPLQPRLQFATSFAVLLLASVIMYSSWMLRHSIVQALSSVRRLERPTSEADELRSYHSSHTDRNTSAVDEDVQLVVDRGFADSVE